MALSPSLHNHYGRFVTTTEQSAPLRRIGTFGLEVGAACAFTLGIAARFSRSLQEPAEIRAAYMPDVARSVSGHPPN
jgi:hypothetical protein